MVYTILLIVQVVVALSLVGLILVQHGKGADAGAAFGSGASGTVFGAQGAANFMTRATAALATVFFAISLTLAYLVNGASAPTGSVTDQVQQQQAPESSLLSDENNNGVPGEGALTDDGASSGTGSSAPDQSGGGAEGAGDESGAGASGDADGADTSAEIPE
ncbi:preprotein translocase subunit SecG [Salinisphaera orenii]|uniref:Protein-export membrane protein SecG n=1 Tax=Salinisphaera orenii YIM 95161 TaxID=1051139 RepID=A0A423Q1T2_9GAMM|nr:preprotein translocase subunit SecG [Salinisphaera halophila YIM 95161]